MDLSEFLLARIAKDEAAARGASPGHWYVLGPTVRSEDGDTLVVKFTWSQESRHITRWDPARVLAECDAKRRIVEDLQDELANQHDPEPTTLQLADRTLRALALPYADHPDYREEWKP